MKGNFRINGVHNSDQQKRCGARSKRTGQACRGFAMPNGRCYYHGGATPKGKDNRHNNLIHGRYTAEARAARKAEAKARRERKAQFAALFEDASKRKFDLVLFWALDRFSREGMVPTINHLQRLDSHGVAFHSYTEAHLATDNELVRNILLAVMSSLAKVEAQKISERTKAGLRRVVAEGVKLGRRRVDSEVEDQVRELLAKGVGKIKVAKTLGVGTGTVQRIARGE
jgi:DNA invertase Pin-like site-specific DNA recombinase